MHRSRLAEGKTKIVLSSGEEDKAILVFKDDITAADGKKHSVLSGKGKINASVTSVLLKFLERSGLRSQLIEKIGENELLVWKLRMIPIECVCRIHAAGHMIGIGKYLKYGQKLDEPVVEFFLKDDSLHDPMINWYHISTLRLASREDIAFMERSILSAAQHLEDFMTERKMKLVDFKLEFGRDSHGNLLIGDELDTDSMRLWDLETSEILDKDRFRKDMPEVFELGYWEPYRRICGGQSFHR